MTLLRYVHTWSLNERVKFCFKIQSRHWKNAKNSWGLLLSPHTDHMYLVSSRLFLNVCAMVDVFGQVCCKKTGCAIDGADWLPVAISNNSSLLSAVRLNVIDCSDLMQLTGLRYGWRETPFQYLRAALYSKENSLPAPPFITFHRAPEMHTQQHFIHKMKWLVTAYEWCPFRDLNWFDFVYL